MKLFKPEERVLHAGGRAFLAAPLVLRNELWQELTLAVVFISNGLCITLEKKACKTTQKCGIAGKNRN